MHSARLVRAGRRCHHSGRARLLIPMSGAACRLALAIVLAILVAISSAQLVTVEIDATTPGATRLDSTTAATAAAAAAAELSAPPLLYNLTDHHTAVSALHAYAAWHNRTLADPRACSQANVLVWQATAVSRNNSDSQAAPEHSNQTKLRRKARHGEGSLTLDRRARLVFSAVCWPRSIQGWGDSVNALTSAFRYALGSSRLLFIQWSSRNEGQIWKVGLEAPGFAWDLQDALEAHPECRIDMTQLGVHPVGAAAAVRKETNTAAAAANALPRILKIAGSIVSSHPLAGSLDRFYSERPSGRMPVIYLLSDGVLQTFLLRPNARLRGEWIAPVVARLTASEGSGKVVVVGMQIRSGYADAPEVSARPSNANFLAGGDEKLFVAKLDQILRGHQLAALLLGTDNKSSPPPSHASQGRVKVFLMTDHPEIRTSVERQVGELCYGSSPSPIEVVSVSNGSVSHCGPGRVVSHESLLRMLAEWFVFKLHTHFQVVTAWSLFGASAVEGLDDSRIARIDASNCGQPGAKPCQRG